MYCDMFKKYLSMKRMRVFEIMYTLINVEVEKNAVPQSDYRSYDF